VVSHRTGLILSSEADKEEYRAFHLAGLPLPPELARVFSSEAP
jgi:hypothetical protein